MRTRTLALALACLAAAPAARAETAMDHAHDAPAADAVAAPSTEAYRAADAAMHDGMAIDYTGDADVDFARSMIPHHQGAIDMATVELEFGTDPEMRKLAEEVIAAQQAEITRLLVWLSRNGR